MVDEPLEYEGFTPDQREGVLDALAERIERGACARCCGRCWRRTGRRTSGPMVCCRWPIGCHSATTSRPALPASGSSAAHALDEMPLLREQYVAGKVGFDQLMHALSYAQPDDDAELAELLPKLSCAQVQAIAQARRRVRARDHDEARAYRPALSAARPRGSRFTHLGVPARRGRRLHRRGPLPPGRSRRTRRRNRSVGTHRWAHGRRFA